MRKLSKFLIIAVVGALLGLMAQRAEAWWGPAPGYNWWRSAYIHDPAYRWGPPHMRNYIRDLYLRGPAYADWRRWQRGGRWW